MNNLHIWALKAVRDDTLSRGAVEKEREEIWLSIYTVAFLLLPAVLVLNCHCIVVHVTCHRYRYGRGEPSSNSGLVSFTDFNTNVLGKITNLSLVESIC